MTTFRPERMSGSTLYPQDDGGVSILSSETPTMMQRIITNLRNLLYFFHQPASIHNYDTDGNLLKTLPGHPCTHAGIILRQEHEFLKPRTCNFSIFDCYILGIQHLAISCSKENVITLHNTKDGTVTAAKWESGIDGSCFRVVGKGQSGTVLAFKLSDTMRWSVDTWWFTHADQHDGEVIVFECSSTVFKEKERLAIDNPRGLPFTGISYLETGSQEGLVIVSHNSRSPRSDDENAGDSMITATRLKDKLLIWRLDREDVMGKIVRPQAICSDNMGRLYVADTGEWMRILVLDGSTGCTLQVLATKDVGPILSIGCCKMQPHLYVSHKIDFEDCKITCYKLEEKDQ